MENITRLKLDEVSVPTGQGDIRKVGLWLQSSERFVASWDPGLGLGTGLYSSLQPCLL